MRIAVTLLAPSPAPVRQAMKALAFFAPVGFATVPHKSCGMFLFPEDQADL